MKQHTHSAYSTVSVLVSILGYCLCWLLTLCQCCCWCHFLRGGYLFLFLGTAWAWLRDFYPIHNGTVFLLWALQFLIVTACATSTIVARAFSSTLTVRISTRTLLAQVWRLRAASGFMAWSKLGRSFVWTFFVTAWSWLDMVYLRSLPTGSYVHLNN